MGWVEGTLKIHYTHSAWFHVPSSMALDTSRVGEATGLLGNLFQDLTTLTKENFLVYLNLPFFSLKAFPLHSMPLSKVPPQHL